MKTRKKGYSYVANVVVNFSSLEQAENFCHEKTMIGKTVAEDLKDDDADELDELFASGEGVSCEVDFADGMSLDAMGVSAVQTELNAAVKCGAEFTLKLRWSKDS